MVQITSYLHAYITIYRPHVGCRMRARRPATVEFSNEAGLLLIFNRYYALNTVLLN